METGENEYEFEIPFYTDKTEEELKDIWLKKLEDDFFDKVKKYEPLAKRNNWILPTDPLGLFKLYFSEYQNEKLEEYKDNPTSIKKTLSSRNDEEILVEFNNVALETTPIFYELPNGQTIRLPRPEIPETYIEKWIRSKRDELNKIGMFSGESNLNLSAEKNKEIGKGESSAVRYLLFTEMFEEKKIFQELSIGQREIIIGYILGVGSRTAQGIKNNEAKYIDKSHRERARELLEKIKKGDIL